MRAWLHPITRIHSPARHWVVELGIPTTDVLRSELAFVRFDTQDSGCISYGIDVGGEQWFVKQGQSEDSRSSLRRATALHREVHHSAIVPLVRVFAEETLSLVYPWQEGTLLNHSTTRGSDRGGLLRLQALSLAEVEAALLVILEAHQALAGAGFVAVDLYDGCLLYDFDASEMFLIDLDEYRMGSFVLEQERLPGSLRYMAPEELRRGSQLDERTTVHALGRTIQHLLDSVGGWRGTEGQRGVMATAVASEPRLRYQTVDELVGAWLSHGS